MTGMNDILKWFLKVFFNFIFLNYFISLELQKIFRPGKIKVHTSYVPSNFFIFYPNFSTFFQSATPKMFLNILKNQTKIRLLIENMN